MDDHGYTITDRGVFMATIQEAIQRVHDRLDVKVSFDKPLDEYSVGDVIFIPKFQWYATIEALPDGDRPMRLAIDTTYNVPVKLNITEWDVKLAPEHR